MNVCIANEAEVRKKLSQLREGGAAKLHLVSDFDRTLTQEFVDGKHTPTIFAQLFSSGALPQECVDKCNELYAHYRPIELDTSIILEEKIKHMIDWAEQGLQLFITYRLHKSSISKIAKSHSIVLRPGTKELLKLLDTHTIPLLIFSGGITDMIKEVLAVENSLYHNTHIISNTLCFDHHGYVKGFEGAVIHAFNKNETQVKNTTYLEQVRQRNNCILIGDHLGDIHMTQGLEHDTIFKIGLLNTPTSHTIKEYQQHFDVVLLNDESLQYVVDLLQEVSSR